MYYTSDWFKHNWSSYWHEGPCVSSLLLPVLSEAWHRHEIKPSSLPPAVCVFFFVCVHLREMIQSCYQYVQIYIHTHICISFYVEKGFQVTVWFDCWTKSVIDSSTLWCGFLKLIAVGLILSKIMKLFSCKFLHLYLLVHDLLVLMDNVGLVVLQTIKLKKCTFSNETIGFKVSFLLVI